MYEYAKHNENIMEQLCAITNCTNNSYTWEYYDYDLSALPFAPEKYLVPTFFGLIFIIGLIGNSLVVYVVLHNGPMKTVTNLYIVNLAVSDLTFLVCCVPFTGYAYALPYWPFGEFLCEYAVHVVVHFTKKTRQLTHS